MAEVMKESEKLESGGEVQELERMRTGSGKGQPG